MKKFILGFCSHPVMWTCPHCDKKYLHHSSRRRHILTAHDNNMKRKNIFDTDSEESNESQDEKTTMGGSEEPDTTTEEECEEAWRKIILEVAEQLREDDPGLSEEDQYDSKYILDVMIPAVMRAVEAKLEEADCIRDSETYTAVEEEKEKLMDNGMGEWEAKKMAQSNRRYLIGRQIDLALKKEDSEEEDEINE